MKYTIPEIPPSNNKFIGRTNFREYQAAKRYWQFLVSSACQPRPANPIIRAEVKITYYFPDKIRRDPDNYSGKMLLDGLVHAKILADDSFANIVLVLRSELDRKNPRTEIEITEASK